MAFGQEFIQDNMSFIACLALQSQASSRKVKRSQIYTGTELFFKMKHKTQFWEKLVVLNKMFNLVSGN